MTKHRIIITFPSNPDPEPIRVADRIIRFTFTVFELVAIGIFVAGVAAVVAAVWS